jgi:hypothetical protein
MNSVRSDIVKQAGSNDLKKVATKASEMWKALSAEKKKPFEEQYAKAKKEFDEFLKTDEGQAAAAEKKGERQEKKQAKVKKEMKVAAKSVEKDEKLKKPTSSYWMWLNDNREKVVESLKKKGAKAGAADVGKAAGEMWKTLPTSEKAPYEAKSKAEREAYEAYIKTDEGAAALKAHKDAVVEAKSAVKGAPPVVEKKSPRKRKTEETEQEADESTKEPTPKKPKRAKADESVKEPKRAKADESAKEPSPKKASPKKAKGKGKGKANAKAPEQPSDSLDNAVLADADKLGYKSAIQNLANRPDIATKKFQAEQILDALKASNGLVNKAKAILLAGA